MRILGLSGSLRAGSSNTALLGLAGEVAGPGVSVEVFGALGELPYFNPDLDAEGAVLPEAVARLRAAVAGADGLVISTPEYAHGVPGVLKNALDWLVSDTDFPGKRVAVWMGSASGGEFARAALVEVLRTMSANVVEEACLTVAGARVRVGAVGGGAACGGAELRERVARAIRALGVAS